MLLIKLKYAHEAIEELTLHNTEYLGLLVKLDAHMAAVTKVTQPKPDEPLGHDEDMRGLNWIMGTWLSSAKDRALLGHIEDDWVAGDHQRALACLDILLMGDELKHRDRVNVKLLKSAILRSCEQLEKALTHAEEALGICARWPMYDLEGKAQFHRGLAYLQMDLPADASLCFTLASHTEGHTEEVAIHKRDAEEKRTRLPAGDPKRMLSTNFKPTPER